jgi:CshA-type fibril repeat protein
VTFTPLSTFAGTATPIKYVVADSNGMKASSTITPTVAAGEVPTESTPSADNETSTGASDVNQVIDVLVGDTASAGKTLTPTSVRLCVTGTADASCTGTSLTVIGEGVYTVDPATGVVTFNPEPTFSGTATPIKYIVKDSADKTASATITPTVQPPVSSPPSATPQTKSVIPGGSVSFTTVTGAGGLGSGTNLNASATCLLVPGTSTCDADGVVAIAGEGTYTLDVSTGVVTYVAAANAVQGTRSSISYRITDGNGFKATSTLTPIIPPPPTADNETSSGSINTAQVIDVVTGDAAGSGATLDSTTVRLCATGTATASCTGTTLTVTGEGTYTVNTTTGVVTFVPVSTFTGTATPIKYVIADSTGQKAAATITPTVVAPATGPSAEPESKTVLPGNSVSFTTVTGAGGLGSGTGLVTSGANATCLFNTGTTTCAGTTTDGFGNTYSTVTVADEGTYTLNLASGVVTFAAAANVTPGQKTPITYRITDANGLKATSTLTPIIPPPPTASPDSSQGVKNTEQTLMPLNNDTPGSSIHSPFVATSIKLCIQGTSPETTPNCSQTSVTVAGQGTYVVNANGTVTFTPVTDYVSVNYQSSTGPVVSVPITPVHYTVLDTLGQKAASTLTPKVVPPPAPITAVDTGTAEQGSVVELSPWTNDSPGVNPGTEGKPDPQLVPTSIRLCRKTDAAPACTQESLTTVDGEYVVDTSTGKVTFTHVEGFEGTVAEPVTYIIANNWTGFSGTGISTNVLIPTITAPVPPAPSPEPEPAATSPAAPAAPAPSEPKATNDAITGPWDTNQTYSPLTNDSFTASDADVSSIKLCAPGETPNICSQASLTVAGEGTYTVNPDATVTFDPVPAFYGVATPITYQAIDKLGRYVNATITPTVVAPPDNAKVFNQSTSTKPGVPQFLVPTFNGIPSTGATFVDATLRIWDPRSSVWASSVKTNDGMWEIMKGRVRFTPNMDFRGETTLPYSVQDTKGVVLNALLIVIVDEDPVLPETGASPVALLFGAFGLIALGVVARRRSLKVLF